MQTTDVFSVLTEQSSTHWTDKISMRGGVTSATKWTNEVRSWRVNKLVVTVWWHRLVFLASSACFHLVVMVLLDVSLI